MAFEMSPSSSAWEEAGRLYSEKHGFPIIRGTFLRVPIARTIVYWGPPIPGNYHISSDFRVQQHQESERGPQISRSRAQLKPYHSEV